MKKLQHMKRRSKFGNKSTFEKISDNKNRIWSDI